MIFENALNEGEVKTIGTDIDKSIPPVSRFDGDNSVDRRKSLIDNRLTACFEKIYGVGGVVKFVQDEEK